MNKRKVALASEREAALVLAAARGVGPAVASSLRRRFGSYLDAVAAAATGGGLPPGLARAIVRAVQEGTAGEELRLARRLGARYAVRGGDDYPAPLDSIARPPIGLYVSGAALSELQPALAVVGTRAATRRGLAVARDLAFDAASAGLTVVSGLARGIDTAAHEGALEAGRPTVAVLGTGLGRVYPRENDALSRRISENGALVSEYPVLQGPRAGSFPERNRIIAGLSAGVVVVEAGARSGALITAARALEEGREVFAVPGPVTEPLSSGPNGLIKAGAKLVEGIEDILVELEAAWGPLASTSPSGATPIPSGIAARPCPSHVEAAHGAGKLLGLLSEEPRSVDELSAMSGMPASAVASALFELEVLGKACSCPGGRYATPVRRALRGRS